MDLLTLWRRACVTLAVGAPVVAWGQGAIIPPEAVTQLQQSIGDRVEIGTILGGDYAAAGGVYSFRGGSVADFKLSKLGGGGDISAPMPLGLGKVQWAPVLMGNLGRMEAVNRLQTGILRGNENNYDTKAVQGGVGARFYLTETLSLAPTLSGLYGHTENTFTAGTPLGQAIKNVASGTYVDWKVDTWSIVPGIELRYDWTWGRSAFEFRSRYGFYHTQSFQSSAPTVQVEGDSQTWENKLDADIPLGLRMAGGEWHAGGFFSRTELFGGAAKGMELHSLYTGNGRFVFDPAGKLWKVRWVGVGASYFWGEQFAGWSMGLDLSFKF